MIKNIKGGDRINIPISVVRLNKKDLKINSKEVLEILLNIINNSDVDIQVQDGFVYNLNGDLTEIILVLDTEE